MKHIKNIVFLLLFLVFWGCKTSESNENLVNHSIFEETSFTHIPDSLLLEKYELEMVGDYLEDIDSISKEELDSILVENRMQIVDRRVTYAPDKSFKIFTIQMESCGAYCNSNWKSWVHFNLNTKEKIEPIDLNTIQAIYKLPDYKYLVLDESGGRSGTISVSCESAHLISFSLDSIIKHPIIQSKPEDSFGFCQENGVDMEESPYIKYDVDKKQLVYLYGTNYGYSHDVDIDTIRQGQFNYSNGVFILEKENITVNDRENQRRETE